MLKVKTKKTHLLKVQLNGLSKIYRKQLHHKMERCMNLTIFKSKNFSNQNLKFSVNEKFFFSSENVEMKNYEK